MREFCDEDDKVIKEEEKCPQNEREVPNSAFYAIDCMR